MKKISIYTLIILFGLLIIPLSVLAVQSGGGYIVYDQVSNSLGVNLSTVPSSPSPTSVSTPSGGEGGSISSSGQAPLIAVNVPTANIPLIPQVNNIPVPLITSPPIGQSQNTNSNNNVGVTSITQPALFDINAQPVQPKNQNTTIFFLISMVLIVGVVLGKLLLIVIRQLRRQRMTRIMSEMKKENRPTDQRFP